MAITEQDQKDFELAVEQNVELVERLIKIMGNSPYTERNDLIATLTGFLQEASVPEENVATAGITAIVMLMLERRERE